MTDLSLDIALLVVGVVVLYFGAEWLVRGAARLAGSLGVSAMVVGLTVVSFGTSAPELVVSTVAALGGNADLAVGNVIGSNLANIGLILGLSALIAPLDVKSRVVWREMPVMVLVTLALYPLAWDGELSVGDGVLLLLALVAYLGFVFQSIETEAPKIFGEYEKYVRASMDGRPSVRAKDVALIVWGSACLVVGGYVIVEGALGVATALGISQVVIGLTVVAVGTSLPELATSLVAASRGQADIAVGNVIGSNIFNLAAILGSAAVLEPIAIPPHVLSRELPALLVLSLILFPLLRSEWRIQRWEGALLVGAYITAGVFIL
jgi:cation:H+ antiporter